MKKNTIKVLLLGLAAGISACTTGSRQNMAQERNRYEFSNILNIALTPDSTVHRAGCFTDAGSWMGFTIPQQDKWVNGFCGPFSIDNRIWFAQSIVEASLIGETTAMTPDSASYFPGEDEAKTDLNVVIGLCVGHDSLFYKYAEAYTTTLVTKDRVTGNNPAAALYTANSYYRKKFFKGNEKK